MPGARLRRRRVAFLRHVGPYQAVGPTFQRLAGWAGSRGLFGPGTLMLGICHDDPDVTPADKIRYDCCITVDDRFQPEGEVGVARLWDLATGQVTRSISFPDVLRILAVTFSPDGKRLAVLGDRGDSMR